MSKPPVEIRDVVDGLWLWRQPHPAWREGYDWEPEVTSWAVQSRGARVLLDPLLPPPSAPEAWARIDAFDADTVVIPKPDHVRDVDLIASRSTPVRTSSPRSSASPTRRPRGADR